MNLVSVARSIATAAADARALGLKMCAKPAALGLWSTSPIHGFVIVARPGPRRFRVTSP